MKLSHKIMLGFLVTGLLFLAFGIIVSNVSQQSLQDTIGDNLEMLVVEILNNIDKDIYYRIEEFRAYSRDLILMETLMKSNQAFEGLENIQDYINKKDHEWTSAQKKEITPFMAELINNKLSDELREKMEFHEERNGYRVVAEIFVTNRYGANVAQTGKTTDYRQGDEEWWQRAMNDGLYVQDVAYDESSDIYSIDLGLRIDDKLGNPMGVIKIVISYEEVSNIINHIKKSVEHTEQKTIHLRLIGADEKLIYSSDMFNLFEDFFAMAAIHNELNKHDHKGYILYRNPGNRETLLVHAHSNGHRDYKGLGWILIIEQDTDEIFGYVYDLKNNLLLVSMAVAAIGILTGLVFSHSITRNIRKMTDASIMISNGDLNTQVDITSRDEIGQFAIVFNRMVRDLKASRDNLANLIVELEKAENEQKKIAAELGRSNSELRQFAYVASHDLREPLRMVTSYLQLLERRYRDRLDTEAGDFIRYAVDGATRMNRLILDLLTYSRVNTLCSAFTLIDSTGAFQNAIDNLQLAIEESGAVVTHGPLPSVTADERQLTQLFQNLICNAIKFHDTTPPVIHVSAEEKGDEWAFSVRDNGIGIAPEYYDRIFGVFQRLHATEDYPGTGIGLAICKKIAEQHGGRIWVESEHKNGSTFNFTIKTRGQVYPSDTKSIIASDTVSNNLSCQMCRPDTAMEANNHESN